MALLPDVIGKKLGDYDIQSLIGSGGMGAVYRGVHVVNRRDVAVKILAAPLADFPSTRKRFEREAQTVAALVHPHICPVYAYGTHDGLHYMVLKLLSDWSLMDWLESCQPAGCPVQEIAGVLLAIGEALDYAHGRGVIHRDIKLKNVMFDAEGQLYLVDFGIAQSTTATSTLTSVGKTMGTPHYMAPERWMAENAIPKTDQYAVGVLAYVLCTGRLPFESRDLPELMQQHLYGQPTPIHALRPELPERLNAVVKVAMAKDPAYRFPSVTAFAKTFEHVALYGDSEDDLLDDPRVEDYY